MTWLDPVDKDELYPKITSKYRDGAYAVRPDGSIPVLYEVLGNSPAMLSAWLDFAWTLRFEPSAPRGLRELAILLVGHRLSAPYCINAHDRMTRAEGMTDAQIEGVSDWAGSDLYNEDQRAVFELVEAMLSRTMTAEIVDRIRKRFGADQTIELVLTVAFYQMVASTTTSLDLLPADEAAARGALPSNPAK
jgi:AhpD family alkylhydroperoxidase